MSQSNLEHFPGTAAETLEAVFKLAPRAVVILVQGSDETWTAHWSRMQMRDLVYAERCFGLKIAEKLA